MEEEERKERAGGGGRWGDRETQPWVSRSRGEHSAPPELIPVVKMFRGGVTRLSSTPLRLLLQARLPTEEQPWVPFP